jgi:hypothetical protein
LDVVRHVTVTDLTNKLQKFQHMWYSKSNAEKMKLEKITAKILQSQAVSTDVWIQKLGRSRADRRFQIL